MTRRLLLIVLAGAIFVAPPASADLVDDLVALMDLSEITPIGTVTLPPGSATFDSAVLDANSLGLEYTGETFAVDSVENGASTSFSTKYKFQ